MDKFTELSKIFLGAVITYIGGFFGGIDGVMVALLIFMSLDYLTGVAVAIKNKRLSSEVGFWGLVRKVCILMLIGVANMIDVNVMGTGDIFRTMVALYYIGNEGVSLLENIGSLGVILPPKLMGVLAQLKNDNGGKDDGNDSGT